MTPALLLALALGAPPQAKAPAVKWQTNFAEAQKLAKKEKKPLLVNFTGSDWCHWCQVLKKEVFDQKEFAAWAKKNVILVEVDFPQEKKQSEEVKKRNLELAKKYKVQGFPTIYFMKADGKIIGQSGYMKGGPKPWLENADKQLKEAAKKPTASPRPTPAPVLSAVWPEFVKKELYADVDFRGKKAPKLEVESWLNGGAPDAKGKVILVDFWATWCGPCRAVIPEMNEWAEKYKDDLVVVGISDEKADVVNEFMKKTPMNYHVAIDATKKMSNAVKVKGIPHVLVITQDGIVRWQGFPLQAEDKLTAEKLEQIIAGNKTLEPVKD